MLQSNQKTSLLIPFQLPEFIRENPDYSKFVTFLQAYYQWLEQNGGVLDYSKNLLNYDDIDQTTLQFQQYFVNDFLAYFPPNVLADKTKAIKVAKQLYQNKGTPASYQFLFRVLYNSDIDFFYTKDVVLKASAGKWYVPRSLKLATSDPNFLKIQNLRVFGNISKSIATVDTAVYDGLKTEVFISNIERLFQSGETVTVVDNNNQPLYFLNGSIVPAGTIGAETLTALIVGQISNVNINPNFRGELYYTNDPVVVYGGLNQAISAPIGATVEVGTVTSGYIQNMTLVSEGYGYSLPPANTNTTTLPVGNAFTQITFSNLIGPASPQAPIVIVGALDSKNQANTSYIPVTSLSSRQNWTISSISSLTLAQNLAFTSLTTNPIASVIVANKGGGLSQVPTFNALSEYNTDQYQPANLAALGILAPIQIVNAGSGYSNGANIIFTGGSGFGAHANITVNGSGAVNSVNYYSNTQALFPNGGVGYNFSLPSAVIAQQATGTIITNTSSNVVTGNGTSFLTQFVNGAILMSNSNVVIGTVQSVYNANTMYLATNANANTTANGFYLGTYILNVPSILGVGAAVSATTSRIGSILTFNVIDNGEDYVSAPNVSLKVQDLVVTNIAPTNLPSTGDLIYQGANTNVASYVAYVASVIDLQNANPPTNSVYQLRVYNYTSVPVSSLPLNNDARGYHINLVSGASPTLLNKTTFSQDVRFDSANGVITYGDGHAQATASFLNGLVIGDGQYLDTTGQPSSFDVLQSTVYNNYTYELTLNTEITKYRDMLLNLLHPTGMQVIGRLAMESSNTLNFTTIDYASSANSIGGNTYSSAAIVPGSPSVPSNNIVQIFPQGTNNIANVFVANSSTLKFRFGPGTTDVISSQVIAVNQAANTVTIRDNVWTYVANVLTATASNGNNAILNITSLNSVNTFSAFSSTGTGNTTLVWDFVNNGNYSNTMYPLGDIVHVGDVLYVNGASQSVSSVDPIHGIITLSGALASGANGLVSIGRNLASTFGNTFVYTTK